MLSMVYLAAILGTTAQDLDQNGDEGQHVSLGGSCMEDEYTAALTRQLLLLSDSLAAEKEKTSRLEIRIREIEARAGALPLASSLSIKDSKTSPGQERKMNFIATVLENEVKPLSDSFRESSNQEDEGDGADDNEDRKDAEMDSEAGLTLEMRRRLLMNRNREAMRALLGNATMDRMLSISSSKEQARQEEIRQLFKRKKKRPGFTSLRAKNRRLSREELEHLYNDANADQEEKAGIRQDVFEAREKVQEDSFGGAEKRQKDRGEAERETEREEEGERETEREGDKGDEEEEDQNKRIPEGPVDEEKPKQQTGGITLTATAHGARQEGDREGGGDVAVGWAQAQRKQLADVDPSLKSDPNYQKLVELQKIAEARAKESKEDGENMGSVEKRRDPKDGMLYSKYEFFQRYGCLNEWEAAAEVSSSDKGQGKEAEKDDPQVRQLRDIIEWGGQDVKTWIHNVKDKFGITELTAATFCEYGLNGDMLLDLSVTDIRDIGIRMVQAKKVMNAIQDLKQGNTEQN